jgi:cell division protein FtsZ
MTADRIIPFSTVRGDLGPPAPAPPLEFAVFGIGGGGCNALHRVAEPGVLPTPHLFALNTDAQHLYSVHAPHKVLLGRNVCRGRSANSDPKVGAMAAEEARPELAERLRGVRLAFLLASLGGGTGSGSTPVVAKVARELKVTTVALVTNPFTVEGARRNGAAQEALAKLRAQADFTSIFPNDRLLAEHPGLSLRDALARADEALLAPVRALARAASRDDLAPLRQRLRRSTHSGAASATATRQRGYAHAAEAALDSLAHLQGHSPNAAVVTIGTAGDLSPHDRDSILSLVLATLPPHGSVLWGYYNDPKLSDLCEVSILLSRTSAAPDAPDSA